jgi:ribosome-binding protein aMBF1 (putative translation factor)
MKIVNGIKLTTMDELNEMLMKRPGYKEAHAELEYEFALINEIIRQRYEKGLTQVQLAEKMGTKQSAIARFESGASNPTVDFLKRLSQALGLKLQITVQ